MAIKIGIAGTILNKNKRGFESYLRQLLINLSLLDDNFIIFLYTDKELPEFANVKGISVRVIPRAWKTFFWRNIKLPYYARKDGVDVMHFPDNSVWLIPWKPTIVTLHDISPLLLKKLKITSFRLLCVIRILYFFIRKNARLIITDSETSRRDIISKLAVSSEKIAAIPLACPNIFIEQCSVTTSDIANVEKKSNEKYVLFVGGVDRRKNVVALVQAVEIVRNTTKQDIGLVIAGVNAGNKGLCYTPYESLAYDKSIEQFLILKGHVSDKELVQLYRGAAVFVLPSLYEGFGLTVLEAMSCSTPVIVSDSDWGREITGGHALFVDPHSPQSIAQAIQSILTDEESASDRAKQGVLHNKKFSWKKTAVSTLEQYKKQVV